VLSPLPWETTLWTARPLAASRTSYALTDLRVYAARRERVSEIALQDVGDVDHERSRLDRLLGTSTVTVHARDGRLPPVALRHIKRGAQLAALIELLAGDPHASLDAEAVQAALAWEPADGRAAREVVAAAIVAVVAVFAVTVGLQSSSPSPVTFASDDAILPEGHKRSEQEIAEFMESVVMPWARVVLGRIKGGPEHVTCETCHGADGQERFWQMPAVSALPEPHFLQLGWELSSTAMDAQMRNAIYGYLAESDNQARAAYMRQVVMPGMARLLHRPAYDFTRSYEYNRTRAAFGCYHCHRVR
jgi:cytochrome c553